MFCSFNNNWKITPEVYDVWMRLLREVEGSVLWLPSRDGVVALWVLVAWIVVLGAMVPFALSIAALRHLHPTAAGLVATVEPVFASIVAWLWLEQVL